MKINSGENCPWETEMMNHDLESSVMNGNMPAFRQRKVFGGKQHEVEKTVG
jgi:hypothetical protein